MNSEISVSRGTLGHPQKVSRGRKQKRDSGREQEISGVCERLTQLPAIFSGSSAVGPNDDLVIGDDGPLPRVFKHLDHGYPTFDRDDEGLSEISEQDVVFYALSSDHGLDLESAQVSGLLHRDGGPAVIWSDGSEAWYQFGEYHREDGPAATEHHPRLGLTFFWFQHGQLHRDDDLPAIDSAEGHCVWYQRGLRHREDGPALIGIADDQGRRSRRWLHHDHTHRLGDLPALIEADGSQEYWVDGQLHRDDGKPAWISASGQGIGWWVDGRQFHPDPDQPACIAGDGMKTWFDSQGREHRLGDLPAISGPGQTSWLLHGVRHRGQGKPASIFEIDQGPQIITWTEDGIDRAELTVPDYPESEDGDTDGALCLTIFAAEAGETGSCLTTVRTIARYLSTFGLHLDDNIDFSRHPKLWDELRTHIARADALGDLDLLDQFWLE
jgi:hypothetical protein